MATPTSSRRTFSRFSNEASTASVASNGPTVSASVGHDHWANDVLKAVDKANSEAGGSGSNSPESSYCDSADGHVQQSLSVNLGEEAVKAKVLERKRKFHTGRSLELKNLPDGCVEQVRKETVISCS